MSQKRDHKAEYSKRQQRARARGFSGYAQQRRFLPTIRGSQDLARLPESARATRTDALRVLQVARERGVSVEQAARESQLPVDVVQWWARGALEPRRSGQTFARHGDRLLRLRPVFLEGENGVRFVEVRGSNAANRAQRIFDVQYRFIEGRASEGELAGIAGQKIAGQVVESDPDQLEAIAETGGAGVEEAYREVVG